MAEYRLSEEADRDIFEIARYTLQTWSEDQVDRYVMGLDGALQRLAENPRLGRASEDIRAGYFRRRYRSHMIFYKKTDFGILVVRVLHAQMDFIRHL